MNFLVNGVIERKAAERLKLRGQRGLVEPRRLYHNLLTSQTLCFNVFGLLQDHAEILVEVLGEAFRVEARELLSVRLEWAPPRTPESRSGSAFDAFIEYRGREGEKGFVGVECKYAEDLRENTPTPREQNPEYERLTRHRTDVFREGASAILNEPATSQLWYNLCLALRVRDHGYAEGVSVMLSCRDDEGAREATEATQRQLHEPDKHLRWVPYEDILDIGSTFGEVSAWVEHFRLRYLPGSPLDCE